MFRHTHIQAFNSQSAIIDPKNKILNVNIQFHIFDITLNAIIVKIIINVYPRITMETFGN